MFPFTATIVFNFLLCCSFAAANWTTDPRTGKQYMTMDIYGSFSHHRYRDLCAQHGGKLPEPRNEEENDFLDSLDTEMFVLGINDKEVEGHWVFDSDNSPVTWFNWAKYGGIPNGGTQDNCVYMVRHFQKHEPGHTKKSWSDYHCTSKSNYDGAKKQLVCERVDTQGDEPISSVDLYKLQVQIETLTNKVTNLAHVETGWIDCDGSNSWVVRDQGSFDGINPGRTHRRSAHRINFQRSYPRPPVVYLSLRGIITVVEPYFQYFVTEVTTTGFVMVCRGCDDNRLHQLSVYWISIPQ